MSDKLLTGGPAFPVSWEYDGKMVAEPGMTLRDYFAAKAMQAGLSPDFLARQFSDEEIELWITNAAVLSYRLADAMIAERNKS